MVGGKGRGQYNANMKKLRWLTLLEQIRVHIEGEEVNEGHNKWWHWVGSHFSLTDEVCRRIGWNSNDIPLILKIL